MPPRKTRTVASEDSVYTLQDDTSNVQVLRLGQRRMKGFLKSIPHMPLDILHEVSPPHGYTRGWCSLPTFKIFSHLEPSDLLHLTRVAKAFRSFLLNKNALGIWRSARRNVDDLPDCPPFLSEPAYANLMFSPYCHVSFRCGFFVEAWITGSLN